jgi:ADP-dependent NAD(P)H-hydrate dehydratase / NAD(P)H-hydrate epimerase
MAMPQGLYRVAQARAFDAHAIGDLGVPGLMLMQRAGEGALRALRARWPKARRLVVVAGGGNNGGDGYTLARAALRAGMAVQLHAVVPLARLEGDARLAAEDYLAAGGHAQPCDATALGDGDVLVDALLGIGPTGPLRAPLPDIIAAMNACGRPILALDLPSGLHGDTGMPLGGAVRAELTVTFIVPKAGLFLGDGPEYAGRVECESLEVPVPAGAPPAWECLDASDITRALPTRGRATHKGDFGRLLLVGGAPGMPGAPRLAGEAALRVGAGLVVVATAPGNVGAVLAPRPELIGLAAGDAAALYAALAQANVVAVGPGLGTDAWARLLYEAALASGKPLVLDADALNLLAADFAQGRVAALPPGTILTPHPGEAARLLGSDTAAVQADRPAALAALVARTGAIVVLKGAGTLLGAPGRIPAICTRGNPGMAAPGMGDVLTGAIAGILAQCRDPWLAARAGVQAHATAGDSLARGGNGRGLLALDLAGQLSLAVNHPA